MYIRSRCSDPASPHLCTNSLQVLKLDINQTDNQTQITKPKPPVVTAVSMKTPFCATPWLQFLSVSVPLPGWPDTWVLSGFWTLWLCVFACTLEIELSLPASACREWDSLHPCGLCWDNCGLFYVWFMKWLILNSYRSSLTGAICQKSDLCSVKPRKNWAFRRFELETF